MYYNVYASLILPEKFFYKKNRIIIIRVECKAGVSIYEIRRKAVFHSTLVI